MADQARQSAPSEGDPGRSARLDRAAALDRVRSGGVWDVLVIGGGATGLGTAVDAASRGLRTLLLERGDFAQGTSSRSTKLIHGGVRYLRQGRLGLVLTSLAERRVVMTLAPHLVHARGFVVPCRSRVERLYYGTGLKLYDRLAGKRGLGRTRLLDRDGAVAHQEGLREEGLAGGVLYFDGQFDDARYVLALARTCAREGGTVLNHCGVTALRTAGGRVAGAVAVDAETGEEHAVEARCVVNATGVFADAVRALDAPGGRPVVRASQGIHLVVPRAFLPGEAALMVPRTDDGRILFGIPWEDHVLLGTTDTPVDAIGPEPRALEEEVDFLLAHAAKYLRRAPDRSDVTSVFAGLRALPAGARGPTKSVSREHVIRESDSGLISVIGGKWTTYRHMAEQIVDRVCARIGASDRPCVTRDLPLHGYEPGGAGDGPFHEYGADREALLAVVRATPDGDRRVHPSVPYRLGEVAWAARHEMARTVEDVLARRTRALFLDARAAAEAAPAVARVLARELGRGPEWTERQTAVFSELASGYTLDD